MFRRRGRKAYQQLNSELMQRYEIAAQRLIESKIIAQEIFSKPGNEIKRSEEQEFVELRIDDRTETYQCGFTVTEWRIRWNETDQRFMCEDEQTEVWDILQTAKNRYEARRRALKQLGFVASDMDF